MFIQLSNQTKVLTSLQSLSSTNFVLAKDNLMKLISSLNVDARELLSNKRNYGAILRTKPIDSSIHPPVENILSVLLTSEQHLTGAINTLCLTEAILVRDNFSNTLQIIAELESQNSLVTKKEIRTAAVQASTENKKSSPLRLSDSQEKTLPVSNVAPIHLIDVKLRLTQALQPNDKQHENIKNKLNGLLAENKSINLIKQAI